MVLDESQKSRLLSRGVSILSGIHFHFPLSEIQLRPAFPSRPCFQIIKWISFHSNAHAYLTLMPIKREEIFFGGQGTSQLQELC